MRGRRPGRRPRELGPAEQKNPMRAGWGEVEAEGPGQGGMVSDSGQCLSCPDAGCLCIGTILWERNQGGDG